MNMKTPVSILEEYLVSKGHARASYEFSGSGASHCPSFSCLVQAGGHSAEGKGTTKKDAKHDAAKNVLQLFEIRMNNNTELPNICVLPVKQKSDGIDSFKNYVGMLNEKAAASRIILPRYEDCITAQNGQFVFKCYFNNMEASGYGNNKKYAKQQAAKEMLAKIQDEPLLAGLQREALKEIFEPDEKIKQEAISKYLLLMKNLRITPDEDYTEEFSDDIKTWDDLTCQLDQRKIHYELAVYQSDPKIWSFKINKSVLMVTGKDKDEAKEQIVPKMRRMLKNGLKFTSMEF